MKNLSVSEKIVCQKNAVPPPLKKHETHGTPATTDGFFRGEVIHLNYVDFRSLYPVVEKECTVPSGAFSSYKRKTLFPKLWA